MASFALTDASMTFGGTDLSAWIQSINFGQSADELDDTAMGDTAHSVISGLKNSSFSVTFIQDHAAGGPDVTLAALLGTNTAVVYKPTSGAVAATNPSYTVTCHVKDYNAIGNSVGDLATCTASFTGATTVARATS